MLSTPYPAILKTLPRFKLRDTRLHQSEALTVPSELLAHCFGERFERVADFL
jgi:hypothetical protein